MAKKYHVDFALKKDTAAEQPRYLVFFKSRDAVAITAVSYTHLDVYKRQWIHCVMMKMTITQTIASAWP